jgi:YaiO family outer membrane protein
MRALAAGLAAFSCAAATAQQSTGMLEAGVLQHALSAGFPDWRHAFVRGNLRTSENNVWDADLVHARRFGDTGTMLVLGNTHQFSPLWYGNFSVAASHGGFFLPRLRVDLTANRKWGARSELVTTVGIMAFKAKDGHEDRSVLLGLSYYFTIPLVIEGGVRINRSNPGAVPSHANYAALTYGRQDHAIVSLRHGFGTEAYQLIGANALLVDLDSKVSTLTWRQWLRPRQGLQLRAEHYSTPFYRRRGVELALFQEF